MNDPVQPVLGYLRSMRDRDVLATRPVRIDGFTRDEIAIMLGPIEEMASPCTVAVLSSINSESKRQINAERATRYRNVHGAGGAKGPFILLVPQGQIVESSLDEPAFALVHRAVIFQQELTALRDRLGLKASDIEGIREFARFRNAEALYAFVLGLEGSGEIDWLASYEQLGLLGDSRITAAGADIVQMRAYLRENWSALELLLRPGQAPGRMLDELAARVGLDTAVFGDEVLELVQWWHGGAHGSWPAALDFGKWPRTDPTPAELVLEPNLSLPPHRGWRDDDGRIVVDSPEKPCTLGWRIRGSRQGLKVELELVDDSTQQTLRSIGSTSGSSKRLTFSSLIKGEFAKELQELNPQGDVEGYPLLIRARLLDGKRQLHEVESQVFWYQLDAVSPDSAEITAGAAGTAYQALYQYHAELRANTPRIRPGADTPPGSVLLHTPDERVRVTALDVSPQLLSLENLIASQAGEVGPWRWDPSYSAYSPALVATSNLGGLILKDERYRDFVSARAEVLKLVRSVGCMEAIDPRTPSVRSALERFVACYCEAISALSGHAARGNGVAQAIRNEALLLGGMDTIQVELRGSGPWTNVLLVPPTAPPVVAWLMGCADLLGAWVVGPFDPMLKPPYKGWVQNLSAGPRAMAIGTLEGDGHAKWWVYAGNLTSTWACYLPEGVRASDAGGWADALGDLMGTAPKSLGLGHTDAARIGGRIKKYAVTHPYVDQLQIAAVTDSDGADLLEALRIIDEKGGTPEGARSIRDLRYEVSILGAAKPELGRAIDEMTLSPGDAKWRRYAEAVLDNPETVLVPGFAYARRTVPAGDDFWCSIDAILATYGPEGLHMVVVGPSLGASVGLVNAGPHDRGLQAGGLTARPMMRVLSGVDDDALAGTWQVAISDSRASAGTPAERAAGALARTLALAWGTESTSKVVGLEVSMAGGRSAAMNRALDTADWLLVSDPLFAVELLDRRVNSPSPTAILLDFTPEFAPFPGGRVVVATRSIEELSDFGAKFGGNLKVTSHITPILASISARLLLSLSNPTKQVVGGLTGLALTRMLIARDHPGGLVVPIDGHEDMFAIPTRDRAAIKADLLVIDLEDEVLRLHVVESKWSDHNVGPHLLEGARQARHTSTLLRDDYLDYRGVDREVRLENLRDVILFHHARARRHDVPASFEVQDIVRLFDHSEALRLAEVTSQVVGWCPNDHNTDATTVDEEGTLISFFGGAGVESYTRMMSQWPDMIGRRPTDVEPDAHLPDSSASSESGLPTADVPSHGGSPSGDVPKVADAAKPRLTDVPSAADFGESRQTERLEGANATPSDCIRLGSVVGSGRPSTWCPPMLTNGHLMLIGGSGAGKTTALRHIGAELRRCGLPGLVLDFHGDIDAVDGDERHYQFDYQGNDAFINPFHLDPRYHEQLTPTRLKWEFMEAWKSHYSSMGVQQTNYLASLIDEAYRSAGITPDPVTWERQIDFGDILDAFDASDAPDAVKAKISAYMVRYREWQVFHGGREIAVESFLYESARLNLANLDESARNIVADVVLRRLFLLVRALGPLPAEATGWDKFRVFVIIDEAQLLMGATSDAKASLTKYAAEARKFGIGLILATQLRDNVPDSIWGNIDTRLFMQALDPKERTRNAKAAGVDEFRLATLLRGQAILVQSSQPHLRPATIVIEPSWLRTPAG